MYVHFVLILPNLCIQREFGDSASEADDKDFLFRHDMNEDSSINIS